MDPAKVRRRIRRRPTRPTGRPPNEVWQIPRTPRCQVSTCRLPAQTVLPGVAGPRNSGSRCCPPERCRRSLPLPGAVVPRRWRRCWDTHRRDTPHQGCADRSALPRVLGSMVDGSPGSPPGRRFPPRRGSPGPAVPLVAPWSEKPPHRGTAHPVLPGTARPSPGVRNSPPRNHRCQGRRVPPPLADLPAGPDIRTVCDSGSHWAGTTNPRSLPRDPCCPRYRSLRTCFPPAPKRLLPIRTAVCGPTTTDGGGHHPR